MANAYKRVRTGAALVALYAAWHLTGGLHDAVFRMHTPSAASAVTTATVITAQCGALPATTSPSATPSASPTPAAAPQLCVSVQAAQESLAHGKTATWTIQVSDQGTPATAVTVTITSNPAGLTPVFTGSCPNGGGTSTCTVGDMGTAVTPSRYQLQAQITVPEDTTARTLTLTAMANTSPPMTTAPAAGQTITSPAPTAKPSHSPSHSPATSPVAQPPTEPATTAAAQQSTLPVIQLTTSPAISALPTTAPVTTTVAPVSISTVLPQITPADATSPAPAAVITTSPAADIQAAGGSPAATAGSDSFSLSIGMSARTAQILGYILLVLVITLIISKLITSYFTRTRQPRQNQPEPAASTTPSRHRGSSSPDSRSRPAYPPPAPSPYPAPTAAATPNPRRTRRNPQAELATPPRKPGEHSGRQPSDYPRPHTGGRIPDSSLTPAH